MRIARISISAIAASLLALAILVIGTAMHQTIMNGFPIGITAAILILFSAGQNLRELKLLSWIFTIIFSLGMFLIAGSGNQDALLPANNLGYIWSYGAIGLSFLISFWPRIKIRSLASDTLGRSVNLD